MAYLGWLFTGLLVGGVGVFFAMAKFGFTRLHGAGTEKSVASLLRSHFRPLPIDDISISERHFPFRVRADLQRAIDHLFGDETQVLHFCGIRREYSHEGVTLSACIVESGQNPAVSIPPEFEELDIGEELPFRVLKNGLWLLERAGLRFAVLLAPTGMFGRTTGMQFQVGTPNSPEGTQITQHFFKQLEDSILKAESYRGKILSLEEAEHSYSGEAGGITVHKLRTVEREQVILPESTLKLLERNVIQFVQQRERLSQFKQSTKKGLLFYGPPGTGKTHTIHYLARALEGHTTLLISAEQVGLLSDYMTLARLLQPSIVIMEDVDLIARDRKDMNSPCEEVLLNKLLNEMDGLKEDADILFILTTNRPESLEAALASRPGRVDQAIEFPLPDEEGRGKLVRLYSQGVSLSSEAIAEIVRRTDGVSAAFIKELMRRTVQFHIERNGNGEVSHEDIDCALDEMLFRGGSLNLKLLGATERDLTE
ncbi:MAG: 26S protease regulatory subunit [Planctomycetaceae bacterium]|nr:26S protease regulatory subunit [Planctomycetaceae bacterium]